MKKIFCLILCFAMLGSISSCSLFEKEQKEEVQTTSKRKQYITIEEVKKSVEDGKIPEMEFALGAAQSKVSDYFYSLAFPTTQEGQTTTTVEDPPYYDYYEGNTLTSCSYDSQSYYFVNDKISKGAAILVCTDTAFNFSAGNCYIDDVTYSLGDPDVKDVPTSDQLFFCLGSPAKPVRLTYNFDSKRLDFIFDGDNLVMTVLTDTSLYSSFQTVTTTAAEQTNATTTVE